MLPTFFFLGLINVKGGMIRDLIRLNCLSGRFMYFLCALMTFLVRLPP